MKHETNLTVRFGETDLLGHVNNASYFTYLEQARVEFFKELDSGEGAKSWQFILASTKCDFLAQAYFDQALTVVTKVTRIGNKSFQLAQPIYDSKTGETIADAESTIVYFDFGDQKSKSIPAEMREKLEQYLTSEKSVEKKRGKGTFK